MAGRCRSTATAATPATGCTSTITLWRCSRCCAAAAALRAALGAHRPRAVVNAAGKTGRPNVDWCEGHKAETQRVNVGGALLVAEVCGAAGVHLVHLGSGCIFNGPSPSPGGWRE